MKDQAKEAEEVLRDTMAEVKQLRKQLHDEKTAKEKLAQEHSHMHSSFSNFFIKDELSKMRAIFQKDDGTAEDENSDGDDENGHPKGLKVESRRQIRREVEGISAQKDKVLKWLAAGGGLM